MLGKSLLVVWITVGVALAGFTSPASAADPCQAVIVKSLAKYKRVYLKRHKIKGTSWPNLPQVSHQPEAKYRLEGWFKIVEVEPGASPRAYIKGDYYEWPPHTGPMGDKQSTTAATRIGEWEHVVLDFTAPAWGPFIYIRFVAENCTALLDDFTLHLLP